MSDAAALMDRMYRRQRHIYDASRKFYLLARDEAISGLSARPGDAIIEIGCGTGRNLAKIARAWPLASLYGVDISQEMLATATKNLRQQEMANRVRLALGDAVRFESEALFGRSQFDRVFISYALSMIPQWRETVAHAVDLVAPGGTLTIVDFGDCGDLPRWFAALLQRWLALFGVAPRTGLADELHQLSKDHGFAFDCKAPFRRYALYITLTRKQDRSMS